MPRWFLADLRTGRIGSDVQVMGSSTWRRFLNKPETLTAQLNMQDPDTIQMRPALAAEPGRTMLACAVGDVILGAGPVWAHHWNSDEKILQVTAVGMWSYFDHRFVLPLAASTVPVSDFTIPDPSAAGKTKPNPAVGTYLTGLEYGTIAKRWVQQAQAWTGGNVPVVFETDRLGTRERHFEGADFKNLGTVLTQLTQIEDGPDIRFLPRFTPDKLSVEFLLQTGTDAAPLIAGGPHAWDVSAPGSAVSKFSVDVDASQMTGTSWATGGRSADTVLVARTIDATLTDAGYPMLESLDSSHSTVSEQGTLNGYADENALLGRAPMSVWEFDVEVREQPSLGSFWEGDWCTVDVAAYDPATGIGDPYLYEKQNGERRITALGGSEASETARVQTMARI